jgi:hypothetical protein
MNYYVKAEWDADTSVWFVSDTNVPGLCTEAPSAEELFRKLDEMIPETCGAQWRGTAACAVRTLCTSLIDTSPLSLMGNSFTPELIRF